MTDTAQYSKDCIKNAGRLLELEYMVGQIPSVATVSSRLDLIDQKMNDLIA